MAGEILTMCGYRCDLCLAYRENISKEDRRKLLSDGWHKYFGFRIEPEDLYCDGCLKGDCVQNRLLDKDCPVRKCVKAKGIENCSQCGDFICDVYKERLVDFDEMQKKHGKIPASDRTLFIKPYENVKRISALKLANGQNCRMLNKCMVPDIDAMSGFIGNECSGLWKKVVEYISANYGSKTDIAYVGKKYGWALKFRMGKSKTLAALFPERESFTVLIVFGAREMEKVEEHKTRLSVQAYNLVKNTKQLHDGRWVWLRVEKETDLDDLYILLSCKKTARNRNGKMNAGR